MQTNQPILYGIIGILAGVLIGLWSGGYAVNNQTTGMMRMMGVTNDMMEMMNEGMMGSSETGMNMSMNGMMSQMSAVTGIERDEQFLRMMVVHHQGAIAMAESIKTTTERQELKEMADSIISAQSEEIDQMKQWLQDWFSVEVSLDPPAGPSTKLRAGMSQADHEAHHS